MQKRLGKDSIENVLPKNRFTTWLSGKSFPKQKFCIVSINDTYVTFEPGVLEQKTTINKLDFCKIAKGWEEYKQGDFK